MNRAVQDLDDPARNIASLGDLLLKRITGTGMVPELAGMNKGCREEIRSRMDGLVQGPGKKSIIEKV